jgi:hypothetical protein
MVKPVGALVSTPALNDTGCTVTALRNFLGWLEELNH